MRDGKTRPRDLTPGFKGLFLPKVSKLIKTVIISSPNKHPPFNTREGQKEASWAKRGCYSGC